MLAVSSQPAEPTRPLRSKKIKLGCNILLRSRTIPDPHKFHKYRQTWRHSYNVCLMLLAALSAYKIKGQGAYEASLSSFIFRCKMNVALSNSHSTAHFISANFAGTRPNFRRSLSRSRTLLARRFHSTAHFISANFAGTRPNFRRSLSRSRTLLARRFPSPQALKGGVYL